jgi:RHS repeat-associated protein
VEWTTADEGGPDQRTPNLSSVLQEVLNRPGWTSGNALAIIITGSGKRIAKSYDRDMYGAPYLHIEYTVPPSGQLGLQITPNPTTFTSAGQNIVYTYTLTNTGAVPLNGPYAVSDNKVSSVDCSAAQSPLAVNQSTTCVGSYTTTAADVTAGSMTDSATATASDGTQTITSNVATATISLQIPSGPVTILYDYDPLNRLTSADYSTGDYYHDTYDTVGNRKTQARMISGLLTNDSYLYDHANRLTSVNGVTYTWDNNGNLLNDGANTYTYDSANRLTSITGATTTSFAYNGLGDRLQETINGQTKSFTMDLNAGLTQALSDGTNTYIYGVDRIAQAQGGTTEYFLGDALGSVRQMTNANAEITYARAYDPYGVIAATSGASQTPYAYTGEYYGDYNELLYLRARFYAPYLNQFIQPDMIVPDPYQPMDWNHYLYVRDNPINFTDPSGHCPQGLCLAQNTNARDLTAWLYNEMVTNANNPTVRKLQSMNRIVARKANEILCEIGEAINC